MRLVGLREHIKVPYVHALAKHHFGIGNHMAGKERGIEIDDAPDQELQITDEETVELDILNEMNGGVGDSKYKYRVNRVTGPNYKGVREPFCFEGDAATFVGIHEKIAKDHGPGQYRIRIFKDNRLVRRFDVEIDKALVVPIPPPLPEKNDLASVIAEMNRNQMVFMERIITRLEQPGTQTQADPFSMMEKMSTIMKNMRGEETGAAALFGAFTKGIEAFRDMGGNGGSEKGLLDFASDFLKSPMLETIVKNKANPPAVIPLPENNQNPQIEVQQQPQDILTTTIQFLITKAARNADPALYAEYVLDNLPLEMTQTIVNDPQILPKLMQAYPAMMQYNVWFQELLADLKQQAQTETEVIAAETAKHANAKGASFGNAVNPKRGGGNESDTKAHAEGRAGVQEKPIHT